jgi:uncharacterized protein YggE
MGEALIVPQILKLPETGVFYCPCGIMIKIKQKPMHTFIPRWLSYALGVIAAVLLLLLTISQAYTLQTKIGSREGKNTISVSAQGSVMATPDTATVSAGLYLTGASAAAVQNQATEKLNKITAALLAQGVEKENITTSQFSLYPQQNYDPARPNSVTSYAASQQVTVKVKGVDKDTSKLSAILAGLADNGANQINGINFTFEDPDELKGQARKEAVEKARQKAEELAQASGVNLGKVVSVNEGSGDFGMPMPMAAEAGRGDSIKTVAPDIQPGNQEITVTMTLTFEIK